MPAGLLSSQGIDERTFIVTIWTLTAITFLFVPFRLLVRWKAFHRLFADDAFFVLAYLFLLMYAILWQGRAHDLYIVFDVGSGAAKPEADYLHHLRRYVTGRIVYAFLYPLSLWSIKFSFLLFFRRLGRKARCYTFLWWGVLGCNIICLGVWYAVPVWRYTISSIQYISSVLRDSLVKTCGVKLRFHSVLQGPSYRESQSSRLEDENSGRCHLRRFKQVHLVLDLIIIPISLLWNLQVSIWKKLGLIGLFSMTVFVMIASIIRVVIANSIATDASWCFAWAAVEMSTAIIVACLASFRALFTTNNSTQRLRRYQEEGRRNDLERQCPAHLRLRETARPLDDVGAELQAIPLAALELALVKTLTFANSVSRHGRLPVDQIDQSSIERSDERSAPANDAPVHA